MIKREWEQGETYRVKTLPNGVATLYAEQVGETFHPGLGPMGEAECLYVEQPGLGARLLGEAATVVWDVGLGAAANAMAAIGCWQRMGGSLHVVSFDRTLGPLQEALRAHRQDAATFDYLAGWDWETVIREKKLHLKTDRGDLLWEWYLDDFPVLMDGTASIVEPDLIFYDAFSPPKNYEMWKLSHWLVIAQRLAKKDCSIIFHSRSTALRTTLMLAGFFVGIGMAIGDKNETTVAATKRELLSRPLPAEWLARVKRSTASDPFVGEIYQTRPIGCEWWERLKTHPQWKD